MSERLCANCGWEIEVDNRWWLDPNSAVAGRTVWRHVYRDDHGNRVLLSEDNACMRRLWATPRTAA